MLGKSSFEIFARYEYNEKLARFHGVSNYYCLILYNFVIQILLTYFWYEVDVYGSNNRSN